MRVYNNTIMYAQKPLNKIKTRDISDRFWIGSFWKWAFYLMPKDIELYFVDNFPWLCSSRVTEGRPLRKILNIVNARRKTTSRVFVPQSRFVLLHSWPEKTNADGAQTGAFTSLFLIWKSVNYFGRVHTLADLHVHVYY